VYEPILDVLSNHKPISIGELGAAVAGQGIKGAQVLEAVMLLTAAGSLLAAQDDAAIKAAAPGAARLNAYLMDHARGSSDIAFLASPVTGGGMVVPRFPQMFLRALAEGKKSPGEWATSAWALLQAQGQKLILEGKTLDADADNLAELTRQANDFEARHLPMLRALKIAV
jgi:hypothetical protein